MSAINQAYINALLADAAYVNLEIGSPLDSIGNLKALADRLTQHQADYLAANFEIASVVNTSDIPVWGSGFDATVWRGKAGTQYAGQTFVSMRGTEFPSADLLADAELTFTGNAADQLKDMVNWWLRITTSENDLAPQVKYVDIVVGYDPVDGFPITESRPVWDQSVPGEDLISAADLAAGVEVNGHSLGGYLATAFTRLFSEQTNVQHTTTFNSAGFTEGSETAFQFWENLLGTDYGLGRYPEQDEQTNVFAANGINVTTNTFWFEQVGQRVGVFNEEGSGFPNHSIYKLTDSLALANVLAQLDTSMTLGKANDIISAASTEMAGSLEAELDGLRRTLFGAAVGMSPIGDMKGNADSRTTYHQNIVDLLGDPVFGQLQGKVSFVVSSIDGIAARSDFGQFLALRHLTSFALQVTDASALAALKIANGTVAQLWEADQTLTTEQRARGEGNFPDAYLQDRATLLSSLIGERLADDASLGQTAYAMKDMETGEATITAPAYASTSNGEIVFGRFNQANTGDDAIVGSVRNDRLYGGMLSDSIMGAEGQDALYGMSGNDTLTGGKGNDSLYGGQGADQYEFSTGDGFDRITDISEGNTLRLNGQLFPEGKQVALNTNAWASADGKVTYTLSEADSSGKQSLLISYGPNDRILIEDYHQGNFGLTLSAYQAPAPFTPPTLSEGESLSWRAVA